MSRNGFNLGTPGGVGAMIAFLALGAVDAAAQEVTYARDVAPTRLVPARYELLDVLERVEGAVGLVIFAEEPYPVTPLTDDPDVIASHGPLPEPSLTPGRRPRVDPGIDPAPPPLPQPHRPAATPRASFRAAPPARPRNPPVALVC
mgnify:CR=1 FL=1